MSMDNLAKAFHEELQDVFSAEKQLINALPKMIDKATASELKEALQSHLDETRQQAERVEAAFEETGKPAKSKTCEAMKGLIEEAEDVLSEEAEADTRDALIIACAQKVEHYEIATYGTLCRWAEMLGYSKAEKLLKQNIQEEEAADSKLSNIAETVNREALQHA